MVSSVVLVSALLLTHLDAATALRAPVVQTSLRPHSRPVTPPHRRLSHTAASVTMMSDDGRSAPAYQKKGKLQVITKEKPPAEQTKPKEALDTEGYWRCLLHNDDIHTFEYVTYMLLKIVPNVSNQKAWQLTMTTHTEGVSTVAQTAKPMAQKYCMQLQRAGLTSSISPDVNFEDKREGPNAA